MYGSQAVPKEVFGEGLLLNIFYNAMRSMAPAAWELNEAFLSMWNPNSDTYGWVLPDNFNVKIKVMDSVRHRVHFLNEPYDIFIKEQRAIENGRALGANTIHSLDGMVVREMTRRCSHDAEKVKHLRDLIDTHLESPTDLVESNSPEDDKLVDVLWNHYVHSGFLSARILNVLNANNISKVDGLVVRELLDSLPKKPFEVISIHD